MIAPYLLMVAFFLFLAFLGALDAALTSVGWLTWFNGLPWLRAHFITIGVLLEVTLGVLPFLIRRRDGRATPIHWDIWLALNGGLLLLLIGIPLINPALLIGGGTLIFIATILLLLQLANGLQLNLERLNTRSGRNFYVAALLYLLLGIFLGTGLWLGWGQALGIVSPKEVHVHANLWGFTSLLFAGLLVDLYPQITGRSLAWPRINGAIFWSMAIGALGLVLGPWIQVNALTAGGLIVHSAGTLLLLANIIRPLWGRHRAWTAGTWHLVTAYIWFLLPVVVAPLIVANVDTIAVRNVEQSGAPILVYGWILQFGFALIPYLFARALSGDVEARLGGNWLSLVTIHAGGIAYSLSLFLGIQTQLLQAVAFTLWAISMLPILRQLWQMLVGRLQQQATTQHAIKDDQLIQGNNPHA